jgi:hypothetical protein
MVFDSKAKYGHSRSKKDYLDYDALLSINPPMYTTLSPKSYGR